MSELVYTEEQGGRRQAGVRCPRCARVMAVEWSAETLEDLRRLERPLRLGRCDGCYVPPGEGSGGEDLGGYVYVTLGADGTLTVGTSLDDYREGLELLLSGEARCGCCVVSVVRCGTCETPIATRHPKLPEIDEYVECGYCVHCQRVIGIDVYERRGQVVKEFVDRVASPDEIEAERWSTWRDSTQAELHDVDILHSPHRSLAMSDLDLLEIASEDVTFTGDDTAMTWEAWLSTFGGDLPPGIARPGSA